jgi:formylglycine-generating enzyme required for sulfatase activity
MIRTGIAGLLTALVLMWPGHRHDSSFRSQMLPVQVEDHSLLVAQYEVTVASWLRCYSEGGCRHRTKATTLAGSFPVTGVNWPDVNQYLKWANDQAGGGLRLPTLFLLIPEWRGLQIMTRKKP